MTLLLALAAVILVSPARALAVSGWFDGTFRRTLELPGNPDKIAQGQVCVGRFNTLGHLNADGADLRVATDEGRQVPAQVLCVGPGDTVSFIFSAAKGVKKYYAYFGAPTPPPVRAGMNEVKIEQGLLLDMHEWAGKNVEAFSQILDAWNAAGPLVGRTMIDAPFYGINPFGTQNRTISKINGTLFAPIDGEYAFAIFVEDRGGLLIDGQQVLFARRGPADVSQQGKITLKRGPHELVFYHLVAGSEGRFTIAWRRPDTRSFDVIPRESLGATLVATAGPLDEIRKTLVADFTVDYAAECFFADAYSHRFTFSAREPKLAHATFSWDFGDGQTSTAQQAEHVYLADGVYPVKLTVRVGVSSDSQTSRLAVQRDWAHIDHVAADEPATQSKIVADYRVSEMPEAWLPRAALLHERARNVDAMLTAADRLAALPKHAAPLVCFAALSDASKSAVAQGRTDGALKFWSAVTPESDLQPSAAGAYGWLLLWEAPDFDKAVKALAPFASREESTLRRLYGDALVLDQHAEQGRKLLQSLPVTEDPLRQAARSGAMARTVEYYIAEKDAEAGEVRWDQWQELFPADFLEGYSILLRTRLMEVKGNNAAAAKVAEAFATAVPASSYAPQLLHRASKLLEPTDPTRAAALLKLLKERYPEDPLAQ